MLPTTVVYLLRDPRDSRIRYVGACRDPKNNLRKQLFDAKRRRVGVLYDWLRELRAAGLRPLVTLVGEVPKYNAKDHLKSFKTSIHFTDPPRRQRGPALKYPHDLRRDTPMIHEDYHYQGRTTPDMGDKYIGHVLSSGVRGRGPRSIDRLDSGCRKKSGLIGV